MKEGHFAHIAIIATMTVGLFCLWFTLARANGGFKKNGFESAISFVAMAGVVAFTVGGIQEIGSYAATHFDGKTAGDGVDNIGNAPLSMFMYAGICLAVALLC